MDDETTREPEERPGADGPERPSPESPERPGTDGPERPEAGPQPEDPRGPQAPRASEAPTQPLGEAPRKRLLRSRSDRVLGGVCGGLGRYFDVDPIIFRIAAIAVALLGGAGVLLYLAALLLIPADDSPAAAAAPGEGRNRGLAIAAVVVILLVGWPFLLGGGLLVAGILVPVAVLVAAGVLVWWLVAGEGPSGDAGDIARRAALGVGVIILCGLIALGGAWAAGVGGSTGVAVIVIVAGVAVLAGAFLKPVRWLILPAVVLALSAGTVSAAGLDLDGGVGDRNLSPGTAAELSEGYDLGAGELVLDLRNTELPDGDVPVKLDLGLGSARVIVPTDVCVATSADVGMGEVRVLGRTNHGIDVEFEDERTAPADVTRLMLDADVGIGELRVTDRADASGYHDFRFGPSDEEGNPEGNLACDGGETASG